MGTNEHLYCFKDVGDTAPAYREKSESCGAKLSIIKVVVQVVLQGAIG